MPPRIVMAVNWPPSVCWTVTHSPAGMVARSPLGTRMASTGRFRATGSWRVMTASLRGDGLPLAAERGAEGVPGETRALHPGGIVVDAAEDRQLPERLGVAGRGRPLGDEGVELLVERVDVGRRLP